MPTQVYFENIAHYPGEDKLLQFTVYGADLTTLQDVTGWNLLFLVHARDNPASVLYSKTNSSGVTLGPDPALGQLQVTVLAADTALAAPETYEFRLERTDVGADTWSAKGMYTLLR